MFTVYHSNHLDFLKIMLLHVIKQSPLASPFQKEQILVQSPGMAQWLKIEIAKEQGIVANMDFPLPATFIWRMFTQVLPDVPKNSFFNKEAMTWKLMKLLPDFLDDEDFVELKNYLKDNNDGQKLFQLAGKIADIYDQYLVYRPEWIKAWEAGEAVSEIEGVMPWQARLWQALFEHTEALEQSPYHRANLYEDFIKTIESLDEKPQALAGIERVFIFGISALPPRYLDALKALGKHIDVHYMFANPCRSFWGDIKDRRYLAKRDSIKKALHQTQMQINIDVSSKVFASEAIDAEVGNSLLASMGKLGRDNLTLLINLMHSESNHHDFVNEIEAFGEIQRSSLLNHIKADMLDLIEPGDSKASDNSEKKQEIALNDQSITVEICHSPMREVEVLHDRLLDMFEANLSLTPKDIIVMVADINDYSPAIQAVFGSAPKDRYIPFAISDRSEAQESPILSTFLHLLTLPNSRCSANELLEILQIPAVLRRFKLNDDEFEKIKFWIEESGIRWGLNESTASQFELPIQQQNTWEFGLNRMLLGYAMPSQIGFFDNIKPYDEVQGLSADVAGKLAEFVQVLLKGQKALSTPKTGQEWLGVLSKLFDDIFLLEMEEEPAGRAIRDKLGAWVSQLNEAQFEQEIALVVVKDYLKDKLNVVGVSQRFLAGQVNFCTLMPMRSIPFEVVCLLGMNDADYPRTVAPIGFDLMNTRARAGDRSRRDDDRYLFLEALLSAQKNLYISYVGHSIQDNTEKVPSVLLSELLQYCTQGYCLEGDKALTDEASAKSLINHLCHNNALTAFSPNAFLNKSSFASQWLAVAKGEEIETVEFFAESLPKIDDSNVVELAELHRFYRLPIKYFFNRRLHVYFEQYDSTISDSEPFALDNLERYQLHDRLLDHLIEHDGNDASIEAFFQHQRAEGNLPLHAFGELTLEKEQTEIVALAKKLVPVLQHPVAAVEIDIYLSCSYGKIRLQGWLNNLYQDGQLLYRGGKLRPQEILSTWINHLCLSVMGQGVATYFYGVDKQIKYEPIAKQIAEALLINYVEYFYQGTQAPLLYFPKTAYAALEALKKGDTPYKKAQAAFSSGYMTIGEGENAYISRLWSELDDDLIDELTRNSQAILLPALHQLIDHEEK